MNTIAKILIYVGISFVLGGIIWQFGGGFLGRLPGDLSFKHQHMRVQIPIMSSILVSIALSAILWVIRYFSR
jgi:uncharacterized membrane-anchored protein